MNETVTVNNPDRDDIAHLKAGDIIAICLEDGLTKFSGPTIMPPAVDVKIL